MSKTYLADKATLDTVNTKVGTSGDTESGTPTTLYAGIKNIIKGITELKKSASDGKTKVANAITGKGITTAASATFTTMANNINAIKTLAQGTSDATATAAQILSGKTAYVKGSKITGTIASKGAATYTPKTTNQTIAAGQYLSGVQTIAGSANLVPGNIKKGVNIFGVVGTVEQATDSLSYLTNELSEFTYTGSTTYDLYWSGTATRTVSRPIKDIKVYSSGTHSSKLHLFWTIGIGYNKSSFSDGLSGKNSNMIKYAGKDTISLHGFETPDENDGGDIKLTLSNNGKTITVKADKYKEQYANNSGTAYIDIYY